jgi:tRNA threonylcarbamoyladenosine biosynthesis protein TsaE
VNATSLVTHGTAETRAVARTVATLLEPGDVVLLVGPLGAGKTEFTKGIAEGLGIEETVVSPTFMLAREYRGRLRLLHVDVYRLEREQEVLDLGLDDLSGSGVDEAVTVVEWGDVAAALLPSDHLEVHLQAPEASDQDRVLTFTASGPSWSSRSVALAAVVGTGDRG